MRLTVLMTGALAIAACAPVEAPAPTDAPQPCDAAAARSMIGQNAAAISFPADSNVRVVCTTCPTTRDYRPDRLNVRFNQATGIVESVDCG
ncbi:MAG: hemolysin [Brevundimonas sp.]|nr:hemolysin [Brevundimonas sp.]